MIRVLIVEDSQVIAMMLTAIIEYEEDLEVIGCAKTGAEAILMSEELNPDLITMDIRMPIMDGLTAIQHIMSTKPKPIIVISSNVDDELEIGFKAIDFGALAVLEKPCGIQDAAFTSIQKEIVNTIRAMAEVKLVRRRAFSSEVKTQEETLTKGNSDYKLVAIGCSTGGPQALTTILSALPESFPLPIIVTQHIANGFISGFANWLDEHTSLKVKIATAHETLKQGHVYLAPDDYHCMVNRRLNGYEIFLSKDKEIQGFRPSVTALFNSVATICPKNSIGIILSGMGSDGAEGMLAMREQQCLTIAQDQNSSIVFGMPAAAIKSNAVEKILSIEAIAGYILEKVKTD